MINFIKSNSKIITKLILNQFGASVLGVTITFAAYKSEMLLVFVSCFATAFYLILQYLAMWEEGGKERIRIDGGRSAYKPVNGLKISLAANIPNILLFVIIIIGYIFGLKDGMFAYEWAGNMYAISTNIATFWEACYLGLITVFSPINPICYLLIILPALFVSSLGYFLGLKNIKISGKFTAGQNKKK